MRFWEFFLLRLFCFFSPPAALSRPQEDILLRVMSHDELSVVSGRYRRVSRNIF